MAHLYQNYDSTLTPIFAYHPYNVQAPIVLPQRQYQCANCGGVGHVYKHCNHPITSYGVICFRLAYNHKLRKIAPQFLLVQRKDSLSYVEYIRGKYSYENRSYIMKLFENMTNDERMRITTSDFDILWKELWQITDCSTYQREYNDSRNKFNMLKHGYNIKTDDSHLFFDIQYVLNNTTSVLDQTEWGFPKGRRNINEDDFTCAFREFSEETGIMLEQISVFDHIKPFEEVFSGNNHVRYRHVYYLAISTHPKPASRVNPRNKMQCKEVKDMKWLWYEEAQNLIRPYNVERKELFKRVNQIIEKNIFAMCRNNGVLKRQTSSQSYRTSAKA
jgi:8-oxo-dGTP pyrophosphatase MutT (NUDIX family)